MTTLSPSENRSGYATSNEQNLLGSTSQDDRVEREIKYLHLKAEADLLWEKLKTLKQQKQALEAQLAAQSHESNLSHL